MVVDFWAGWCAPCRAVGPAIESLADDYAGSVKVGKLNIDEHQNAPAEFGIDSIPAVLLFKDGQVIERFVGVQPKERYDQALARIAAA